MKIPNMYHARKRAKKAKHKKELDPQTRNVILAVSICLISVVLTSLIFIAIKMISPPPPPRIVVAPEVIIEMSTEETQKRTMDDIAEGDVVSGEITHYCVCKDCCGKIDGITSSGQKIQNGMPNPYIVACNWLPLGAIVDIDGQEYLVADRGGRSLSTVGRVDIFTPEGHGEALKLGRIKAVPISIKSLSI